MNSNMDSIRNEIAPHLNRYFTVTGAPPADMEFGTFTENPSGWTQTHANVVNSLSAKDRADYMYPLINDGGKAREESDGIAVRLRLPKLGSFTEEQATAWLRKANGKTLSEHGGLYGLLDVAGDTKKKRQEFVAWLKEQNPSDFGKIIDFTEEFLKLRDPYGNTQGVPTLTEEQLAAVAPLPPGHRRIMAAVPGSGKTFSLVSLVENAIYRRGFQANEITVISFTTTAANEFRKRFIDRNPSLTQRGMVPRICTADSLALRIVRYYNPGILPAEMQDPIAWKTGSAARHILKGDRNEDRVWETVAERLLQELNGDPGRKTFLIDNLPQAVGQCSANDWKPDEIKMSEQSFALTEAEIRTGADIYDKVKKEWHLIDFTDIRYAAIKTLEENPWARQTVGRSCRMLIVDEYQDTNLLQKKLEDTMLPPNGIKIMAGDDDQAIYGHGMGGRADMMQDVSMEPNTETAYLTKTRRFRSRSLVNAISRFITDSKLKRINKTYDTSGTVRDGIKPALVICPPTLARNGEGENLTRWDNEIRVNLSMIADEIEKVPESDREGRMNVASQCAILCRTNEQVNRIRELLRTRPEYSMLSCFAGFHEESLKDAVTDKSPEVTKAEKVLESLEIPGAGEPFSGMLISVSDGTLPIPWADSTKMNGYPAWEMANGEPIINAYERWVKKIPDLHAKEDLLIQAYRNAQENATASEAVRAFARTYGWEETPALQAFIQAVEKGGITPRNWSEYRDGIISGNAGAERGKNRGFSIMTMHKSKGLEWDHVQVMGQGEENDLVNRHANTSEAVRQKLEAEETRLLYVAMSRARSTLAVTGGGQSGRFVERLDVIKNDLMDQYRAQEKNIPAGNEPFAGSVGLDGHILPPEARFDINPDSFRVKTFDRSNYRQVPPRMKTESGETAPSPEKTGKKKKQNSLTGKPVKNQSTVSRD